MIFRDNHEKLVSDIRGRLTTRPKPPHSLSCVGLSKYWRMALWQQAHMN